MEITIFSLIAVLLCFFMIRALAEVIFKKLTAHWFSIGVTTSFLLGTLIAGILENLTIFSSYLPDRITIFHVFIMSWLAGLIPLNLVVLPGFYWWDKRIASKNTNNESEATRIPENALHALTLSGGFLGAYIGQKIFKHKTSKQSFQTKHYIVCALSIAIYLYISYTYFVT